MRKLDFHFWVFFGGGGRGVCTRDVGSAEGAKRGSTSLAHKNLCTTRDGAGIFPPYLSEKTMGKGLSVPICSLLRWAGTGKGGAEGKTRAIPSLAASASYVPEYSSSASSEEMLGAAAQARPFRWAQGRDPVNTAQAAPRPRLAVLDPLAGPLLERRANGVWTVCNSIWRCMLHGPGPSSWAWEDYIWIRRSVDPGPDIQPPHRQIQDSGSKY